MSEEIELMVRSKIHKHTRLVAGGYVNKRAEESAERLFEFIKQGLDKRYEDGAIDEGYEIAHNPNFSFSARDGFSKGVA